VDAFGGRWNHNIAYYAELLAAMPEPCLAALDVGCGDGLLVRAMATQAAHVTGVDRDAASIEDARELSIDTPHIDYVEGDALTVPLDGGYDFVSAVASLHHMPLTQGLERLSSLLRPGGALFIVGLYRSSTPLDYAHDAVGVVASHAVRLRRGMYVHSSPITDPDTTYAEVRRVAREVLPGARIRRRTYFRYTLTWTRPG
jgi:2-polyprenyl-3-methyl-5-hydroxy-6-metoxy-1,4-benzoquinol methylase